MLIKNIVVFSVIILIFSCGAPEVKDQYWQDFLSEIEQEIKGQGLKSFFVLNDTYPEDPGLIVSSNFTLSSQLVWSWPKDHPNIDIHKCRIKLVRYLKPNNFHDVVWVIIPQIDYFSQGIIKTETILTFDWGLKLNLTDQQEVDLTKLGIPKEPYPKSQIPLNIIWRAIRHFHSHPKT